MTNPYASPSFNQNESPESNRQWDTVPSGLVSQVRVVAILNAVQGGLELMMGLFLIGMAAVIPMMMMSEDFRPPNAGKQGADPESMFWFMLALYIGMGAGGLLAGILRLVATFKNFRYRSRTLGIVSLTVGMLSVSTCYCMPTGLAILIYGLIVFLNPSVRMAFEMAEQGEPVDKILYEFSSYRPPTA